MKKHLINTIIIDNYEGFKIEDLDGLKSFYIPKELVKKIRKINDIEELGITNSGIYFLIHKKNKTIYIGQTNNIYDRLITHNRDKEKIEAQGVAIAITTVSNSLNKTFIDFLEHYYIQDFLKNDTWKLKNKDMRERIPNIDIYDKIKLDELVLKINIILKLNGVFSKKIKIEENNKIDLNTSNKNDLKYFFYKKAKAIYYENNLILLKGSLIFNLTEDKIWKNTLEEKNAKEIREILFNILSYKDLLLKNNLIKILNDSECILLSDIKLKNVSKCAVLVSGNVFTKGWDEFKNSKGLSLREVYRK